MTAQNPHSTASIGGHPIHPMLIPFPIAFFVTTLVCDLVFWSYSDTRWFVATQWLLGAGVVMALLAAVFGLTDLLGDRQVRRLGIGWFHGLGNVTIVAIEAYNWYLRYQRGPAVVLPDGIVLSAVAVGALLITGWLGWQMVYRHRVGVADNDTVILRDESYIAEVSPRPLHDTDANRARSTR